MTAPLPPTLVGTVMGMAVLDGLPETLPQVGPGALTLGSVASAKRVLPLPDPAAVAGDGLGKSLGGPRAAGQASWRPKCCASRWAVSTETGIVTASGVASSHSS